MDDFDTEPPARRFHLQARTYGRGRTYQLGHGTQNITLNYHYGNARVAVPLDLPNLRLWIDRIASDYRQLISDKNSQLTRKQTKDHIRQLDALQSTLAGSAKGKASLRQLLASGAVQYLSGVGQLPTDPLPEQMMLDFMVYALWPIVEAPNLPPKWRNDLLELTSARIVRLIEDTREAQLGRRPASIESFAEALASKPFRYGALNLLEDFSDPKRGGCSLTAIAIANGLSKPPTKGGIRSIVSWLVAGAAGGIAAVEAEELGREVWEWVVNIEDAFSTSITDGLDDITTQQGRISDLTDHGAQSEMHRGNGGVMNTIDDAFLDMGED